MQNRKKMNSEILIPSQSFDLAAIKGGAIDLHREKASRKSKSIKVQSTSADSFALDVNAWLPACAEHYNISPDIRDYVLHPTVVNISGLPNTNGDSFSAKEWLTFKPKFGCWPTKPLKASLVMSSMITKTTGDPLVLYSMLISNVYRALTVIVQS